MISKHPHVIIVGAGIVGTSLAYHLARQQARVTLLDKAPKPAYDVTEKSFAWINVTHSVSETYRTLRQQAIADWHRLENELNGQLTIDWSGAITWYSDTAETARAAGELANFGCQVRLIDQQEIRLLEPNLKHAPPQAMFAEGEGAINPTLTAEMFITAAREAGATIQLGNEVVSLLTKGPRVVGVVTANGTMTADLVVLAAGVHATELCQPIDVTLPIDVSPAILLTFRNHHRFVNRIVSNPFLEIRAASDTLTLAAEDYIDESTENNPRAIAQRTLERMKEHWQGAKQVKLVHVSVGKRPIPQDGLPLIGRTAHIDGLYVSVMHSGVTLAAVAGRLAAAEILSNQDDAILSPYRPERFA